MVDRVKIYIYEHCGVEIAKIVPALSIPATWEDLFYIPFSTLSFDAVNELTIRAQPLRQSIGPKELSRHKHSGEVEAHESVRFLGTGGSTIVTE